MTQAKRSCFALALALLLAAAVALSAAPPQAVERSMELENFHLIAPDGRSYTIEKFPPASVLAIYFGYTTCMRASPTVLNTIAEVIDRMGSAGAFVQPVFIDVDPDRAAQAGIGLYMQAVGPRFLELTGSPAEIERAERSFSVAVERL